MYAERYAPSDRHTAAKLNAKVESVIGVGSNFILGGGGERNIQQFAPQNLEGKILSCFFVSQNYASQQPDNRLSTCMNIYFSCPLHHTTLVRLPNLLQATLAFTDEGCETIIVYLKNEN